MKADMQKVMARLQRIDDLPLVLTPLDVAAVLDVSRNTAYEIVHSKSFPSFKVGKQYRIRRDRFLQWMIEAEEAERTKQAA